MLDHVPAERSYRILGSLFAAAATFILFSPSLNNDFIGWDDRMYILQSPHISPFSFRLVGAIFSNFFFFSYTPLSLLGHALVFLAFGTDPRGHHLTNLVLHAANAALLFLIATWLLSRWGGFRGLRPEGSPVLPLSRLPVYAGGMGASLFFAFSPIRLESVLAASSLKDVLSGFMALLSILFYFRHAVAQEARPLGPSLFLAFTFFVLGLLAKSGVAALPGIFILFDLLLEGGGGRHLSRERILEKVPFFLAAGAILLVGFIATGHDPEKGSWVRVRSEIPSLLLGMYNLGFYVVKSIWPGETLLVYVTQRGPRMYLLAAVPLLASVLVAFLWRRGVRGPLYAWLGYVILILPLAYFIPTTAQATSGRYAYLSTVPFALLFGFGVAWCVGCAGAGKKTLVAGLLAVIIPGIFGLLSFGQIGSWKDGETIWWRTAAENPPHSFIYQQIAYEKMEKGAHDSARVYYALALSLDTNSAVLMYNLAAASLALGDTASAAALLGDWRVQQAEDVFRYLTLGSLRIEQGRTEEALAAFQRGAEISPSSFQAHYDVGCALSTLGRYQESLAAFNRALELAPNSKEAHFLKGMLLENNLGDPEGARGEYRIAARLGYPAAQRRLLELGLFW
jgi:predicted negative regulator of RcsB-dependent stress response